MTVGVVLAGQQCQFLTLTRCLAALVDGFDGLQAAGLVAVMLWPVLRARQPLAKVMQQAGPAGRQRQLVSGGDLQYLQDVDAGVDFRVMRFRLRHAKQGVDFRQQFGQCATVAQYLNEYVRARFHQGAADFYPAALGSQTLQLARLTQLAHQRHGLVGHAKAEAGVTGGEARNPQHPQWIFCKGGGDVAQYLRLQVALAAVGVDDPAVLGPGHGVDCQVPADQILFQGDVRAGVEDKPAVADAAFALGAGECVLLARGRMQKHRKVLADRTETLLLQLLRRRANHNPVAVCYRQTKQLVADCAADQVGVVTLRHRHGLWLKGSSFKLQAASCKQNPRGV